MAETITEPNIIPAFGVAKQQTADWMSSLPKLGEPEKPAEDNSGKGIEPKPDDQPPAAPKPDATTPPVSKPEAKPGDAVSQAAAKPPEETEEKWPRSSKDWDAFKSKSREKLTAKEAELATVKTQLAELEKKTGTLGAPSPELETLKQERDQLSEQLRLVGVEKHPKFQEYYGKKIEGQIAHAKRLVGSDKAEAIAGLLGLPDSQYRSDKIEESISDLSPMKQAQLGAVLNSIEEIRGERQGEIERAKTDFQKWLDDSKRRADTASTEARNKAEITFNQMLSELQDNQKGLPVFQVKPGDEAWNNEVTGRIDQAKELLFGKPTMEQMMSAALRGVALAPVLQSHKALYDENVKLREQVKSLGAATPKVSSAAKPDAPEPPKPDTGPFSGRKQAEGWIAELNRAQQTPASGE